MTSLILFIIRYVLLGIKQELTLLSKEAKQFIEKTDRQNKRQIVKFANRQQHKTNVDRQKDKQSERRSEKTHKTIESKYGLDELVMVWS